MNCATFREEYVRLFDGEPDFMREELAIHLEECPECQRFHHERMEALEPLRPSQTVGASPQLKERIMKQISQHQQAEAVQPASKAFVSAWWKPALAATIVLVIVAAGVLFKSGAPAYALEQTVNAIRNLRTFHVTITQAGQADAAGWVELSDTGDLLKIRTDSVDSDGSKTVIWEGDKAMVWMKDKNVLLALNANDPMLRRRQPVNLLNPRTQVQDLHRCVEEGTATLQIDQPEKAGEPVTLTVDWLSGEERIGPRQVYTVDPETKWVTSVSFQKQVDGQYAQVARFDYSDFNEPLDPSVFDLEVPEDAMRVDHTSQNIGVAQGTLTDTEVAKEVARQFFDALIAGNWTRAGQIYSGIPGAKMEEAFADSVVGIESIGDPTPHEQNNSLAVPCRIEMTRDGKTSVIDFRPYVREVQGLPGRWVIVGGI